MRQTWDDVENALWQAIVAASGFPPRQVTWSYQNVNEPSEDHITLSLGGGIPIGIDRLKTTVDLSRARGQEVLLEAKGDREVIFSISVFSSGTLGDRAARHVAGKIGASMILPGVRGFFSSVGFSPFDPQPVVAIPDVPSYGFRGRASLDIRCYAPLFGITEFTTYIARVRGTATVLSGATGSTSYAFDTALAGKAIASLAVLPQGVALGVGQAQALSATATYTDGTSGDVTTAVAWSSGSPTIATVDTGVLAGRALALTPGSTLITAALGGATASTTLVVS